MELSLRGESFLAHFVRPPPRRSPDCSFELKVGPTRGNASRAGASWYLWARNLLGNRLYDVPVIFLEPYVMSSEVV